MTNYTEGTVWDHPDLCEPAPRVWMRCGCSYVGWMRLIMKYAGCNASVQGPAEGAVFVAVCPRPQCRLEHDEMQRSAAISEDCLESDEYGDGS